MRWFKCLSETEASMRKLFDSFGYEGKGMADSLMEFVYNSDVYDLGIGDIAKILKIHRHRAEKLEPFIDEIMGVFCQKVGKKFEKVPTFSEKVPKKLEKVSKNFASNPSPDRTPLYVDVNVDVNKIPPTPQGEEPENFLKFWQIYPKRKGKKVGRKECLTYWRDKKLEAIAKTILEGLEAWKITEEWQEDDGKFVPDPIRWLKKERWTDEVSATCTYGQGKRPELSRIETLLACSAIRNKIDGLVIPRSELETRPDVTGVVFWKGQPLSIGEFEGVSAS